MNESLESKKQAVEEVRPRAVMATLSHSVHAASNPACLRARPAPQMARQWQAPHVQPTHPLRTGAGEAGARYLQVGAPAVRRSACNCLVRSTCPSRLYAWAPSACTERTHGCSCLSCTRRDTLIGSAMVKVRRCCCWCRGTIQYSLQHCMALGAAACVRALATCSAADWQLCCSPRC